jgi:pimeloyl-ACP methyl ester carboxylesterase
VRRCRASTCAHPGCTGRCRSRLITRGICTTALARCFDRPDSDEIRFFVDHEFAARSCSEGRAAYLSLLRSVTDDFTLGADVYRAALSHLGRGVLVVHGLQDRVIPLAHARQVAEGLGVAQPRWLDRCGHFPQIEHAEVVNAYLRDFLFAPASR